LPPDEATTELLKCCGSTRWAQTISARRPYQSVEELVRVASEVWWSLDHSDWLEAFRSHPKIGEKKAADAVSQQSQQWSGHEQAGVRNADQEIVDSLARLNREYEDKFGF